MAQTSRRYEREETAAVKEYAAATTASTPDELDEL